MPKAHYYNTCPQCGAALDPGERCDCERETISLINVCMERMNARQLASLYVATNKIVTQPEKYRVSTRRENNNEPGTEGSQVGNRGGNP